MTDTFRKEYKPLTENQKFHMDIIKLTAEDLLTFFNQTKSIKPVIVDERAMALAKTNLEQAVMWAIKAIT